MPAGEVQRASSGPKQNRPANPYADPAGFAAARQLAAEDPGRFHGDIAIEELHFYEPQSGAWIRRTEERRFQAIHPDGRVEDAVLGEGYRPWQIAFDDAQAPYYRWFVGAYTNACFNEVDRHVALGHGEETALHFEGDRWDPTAQGGRGGPQISLAVSRRRLLFEVAKAALVLQGLGLRQGDRIVLNLPNILAQIYYTEAAKRLGVIYTPVFGGLSAKTVSDRLEDLGARVIVTADGGYRNAQIVPYKEAYTDPALDGFRPVRTLLRRAQEVLSDLREAQRARLLAAFSEGLSGEITLAPEDAMRAFGRALDEAGADLPSEQRAALRQRAAGSFATPDRRVDAVLVVRHTRQEIASRPERDLWAHEREAEALSQLLAAARGAGFDVHDEAQLFALADSAFAQAIWASTRPLPVEANFPLFAIYTSGSTGKPKGVVHVHGYLGGLSHTMRAAFGAQPGEDVLYVIADPGWITGQSYMIAAALAARIQSVVAEGAPVFPTAGRFSSIIERYGVTIFKAGATFLKGILADPAAQAEVRRYDTSSLRVATFCAEPVSPVVQRFAMDLLCPDYENSYWATEHGGIVWTHPYGNPQTPVRPDAHTYPLPWVQGDVWVQDGAAPDGRLHYRRAEDGEKGEIILQAPYPYLARTIWGDAARVTAPDWCGDAARWASTYWTRWADTLAYTQGDFACRYADGSFTLHGRSDDVINVAGHRIGTEEIEGALLRDRQRNPHSPVRNAVVIGAPHEEKGLVPVAFVQTPAGRPLSDQDRARLDSLVRSEKGAVAVPGDYIPVQEFPETRSGKYMRRLLADLLRGEEPGDTTSLRNPESLGRIRPLVERWREGEALRQHQQVIERLRYVRVQYLAAAKGREVALVTVDSPPVNALNERTLDELLTLVQRLAQREKVRSVVFTGARGFVAGADVRQLLEEMQEEADVLPLSHKAQRLFSAIEELGKPTVAAVRGVALGGGNEFQMAAHYTVAEPGARFGQPEINLRLLPGYGGTQRLVRLLHAARGADGVLSALRLILGGRSVDAEDALRLGLIHEVARQGDALTRALSLARGWALGEDETLGRALRRRQELTAGFESPIAPPQDFWGQPELRRILGQLQSTGRGRAAERALSAVRTGLAQGMKAGLEAEALHFARAVVDPDGGRRGIREFLDRQSPSLPAREAEIGPKEDLRELESRGELLPEGSAFYPGFTPLPRWQYAYGVRRDPLTGAPRHGDPAVAEERMVVPVEEIGADEALVYVLASDVNFNDIWAATGIPVSPFDSHDEDVHISGSGGVGLVAALGESLRKEGRLELGQLCVVYPGQLDPYAPDAGLDPMAANFRIQGYETPDGSHRQFLRVQGAQLLPKPQGVSLEASAGYLLALGTVYRALYTTLRVAPGGILFAEGAATGTGLEAVKAAAQGGLTAAGMVSSDARERTAKEAGARIVVRRDAPELQGIFTTVPEDPARWAAWEAAGEPLLESLRRQGGGRLPDYALSHAGETAFPRSFQALAPGGKLAFFGASSGYHFTFLGKGGALSADAAAQRAQLRAGESVLVHYGVEGDDVEDAVGLELVEAARARGARIAVLTRTEAQAEFVQSLGYGDALAGTASLEEIARRRREDFLWPRTMPALPDPRRETAAFKEGVRRFQEYTFKPVGEAVGRILRGPRNPRGQPDVVFERAGHDALAASVMLVRPLTGRVVYCEDTAHRRYSFFAPQVWMRQRRILLPTAEILGTHLFNSYEAQEVTQDVAAGRFQLTEPVLVALHALPEAHQEMWENRHAGGSYVANHALPRTGLRTADELYAAWAVAQPWS